MFRKWTVLWRALTIVLIIAAAIGKPQQAGAVGEKIGLVTAEGGVADLSFNYMAYQGLQQAEIDLGVVGSLYEPATSADYDSKLQQCVTDGNVLCFAVGFSMAGAIETVAAANPGVAFAILDYSPAAPAANLRGVTFNEKQAGYLAGALAGKMTGSKVIGVVAGMQIPPVVAFVEGYRNGAQCTGANPNVLKNYTGTFTDPAVGAAAAADMIALGADVIFGAAGATGNGAILYSAQEGVWSIGVDSDQYVTVFGNGTVAGSAKLLTSAMKRLDTAVYKTIQDYQGGSFTSGTINYGLAQDGVGLAPYHEADASIPADVKTYITDVKASIISGATDIDYPCEPRFHAEIIENDILAMDWPPFDSLTVTIDDPSNGVGIDFTDTKTADVNGFVNFNNLGGLQLAPDMFISMTDGTLTRIHTVTNLVVTGVDAATDKVWGTGTAGISINVQYCNNTGCAWRRFVTIQPDGTWEADFSVPGGPSAEEQNILDITPGMRGEALQSDNGGITDYQWYLPNTRIGARPVEDRVEGWEWPLGATVTLNINDPATPANPDYTKTGPVGVAPWDASITWFNFEFNGLYDLKAGDEVSVTDGTTTHDHIVTNLAILGEDPDADTVFGAAEAASDVNVWICGPSGCATRTESVDVSGTWTADFSVVGDQDWEQTTFDLLPGSSGDSGQFDADNDATMINWTVPNPTFGARVKEERVEGWQWPLGETVDVSIDNPATPDNPDFNGSAPVIAAPWDASQTWFHLEFISQFDLKPGFVVTVTDGNTVKTTTVTGYQVTGLDTVADTVSGTAAPGSVVDLWVCGGGGCANRTETANGSGVWAANFAVVGDQDWEQSTFDIQAGTNGDSAQWDAEGDGTMIQWGMTPDNFGKKSPANGAVGLGTSVAISWDPTGHVNTYQLCYDKTNDNQCSNWLNAGTATSKTLSGLTPNTTYYWQVRAVNAAGVTLANNGNSWSFKTRSLEMSKTFISSGAQDGWVLETSENSGVGGSLDAGSDTLRLGDDASRKQYRSVLSFATGAGLPDNAVITKVTLRVKSKGVTGGGNPLTIFQGLFVDMRRGFFGPSSALQTADFASTYPSGYKTYGPYKPTLVNSWYALNMTTAKAYVNKLGSAGGLTQVRLRFKLDDNNNNVANYLSLYSGNALQAANKPQLIVEYYIP